MTDAPSGPPAPPAPAPSAESHAVLAELWGVTPSVGAPLPVWRHAADWLARLPSPDWLRRTEVDAAGVPAEWAWRHGSGPTDGPVVVWLHGGGFVVCSIGGYRVLGARVAAAAGGRTLVVGYRLAPEHPFPAAVHDAAAAYQWVLDQGVDPSRVVLAGDSAGGNLVVAAALALRDRGVPLPAALVVVSPAADLTFRGESNRAHRHLDPFSRIDDTDLVVELYLQGHDPTDPLASPVFGDLSGLPPLLVLAGPTEMLRDDAQALAEVASDAGVDTTFELVDGAFHTWLNYGGRVPEADRSIDRIGHFVRHHTVVAATGLG